MLTSVKEALTYRAPLSVTEVIRFPNGYAFPVCPKCNKTLEREYQAYCDRCGQCLNWKGISRAKIIEWKPKD